MCKTVDVHGFTPYDLAVRMGFEAVSVLLRTCGAFHGKDPEFDGHQADIVSWVKSTKRAFLEHDMQANIAKIPEIVATKQLNKFLESSSEFIKVRLWVNELSWIPRHLSATAAAIT